MASFIICGTASGEQQHPHVCQSQWGYRKNRYVQPHNVTLCTGPMRQQYCIFTFHTQLKQVNHSGSYFRSYFRSTTILYLSYINTKRFATEFLWRLENSETAMYHLMQKLGLQHLEPSCSLWYTYRFLSSR